MSDASAELPNTFTLREFLTRSATAALDLQRDDGSFPPGQNNVYNESETPVRTTSHWLTTLSEVYELTKNDAFAQAANSAASYLLSEEARPYGYTFHSRSVEGKDRCDGLVGQAAPIRGLARAAPILGRPELREQAIEVYELLPFNHRIGLWETIEIDGSRYSFDRTLNHQITFASASAELTDKCQRAERAIARFLSTLTTNMRIHSDGLIKHYIRPKPIETFQTVMSDRHHWPLLLNEIVFHYYSLSEKRRKKEIGYHPINLRGLARLKQKFPEHETWSDRFIDRAIEFVDSEKYPSPDGVPKISYGSMTPGIHTAFALIILAGRDPMDVRQWIEWDIETKFDRERGLLVNNTADPNFQAATIFNLVFFPDIELRIDHRQVN